ncbi:hypothetical protein V7266_30235 [Neobacillus drentensis]
MLVSMDFITSKLYKRSGGAGSTILPGDTIVVNGGNWPCLNFLI